MRIVFAILFSGAILAVPAAAEVTTCWGDRCVVESGDGATRKLSAEEVGKLKRGNIRTAIGNVECQHAADPEICERLLKELFALFPL